jgi:LmbE family N-acetylglucosaminyl deacetylase
VRQLLTTTLAALLLVSGSVASGQNRAKVLVTVWAHGDDEGPVGPILARYAREGVQVHMIIATDGAQGAANTSIPRGPELATVRVEEAACSARALGVQPPILLGFPDGGLGTYSRDPAILYKLTQRVSEELQKLRPDVVITWGPDGGYGHPDHRMISSVVSQLARAGAPGVPEQVFYASIPAEGILAMYPSRGVPPLLIPKQSLFTTRVPFADVDLEAARRSTACHKTQFAEDAIDRVIKATSDLYKGVLPLSSMLPRTPSNDLFR